MVDLSLAIPFYNEEANVEKVSAGLISELERSGIDYELILINNGSSDSTGEKISRIAAANKRVKPVTVAVNKGYGHGIIKGMKAGTGNYIGFSDGDDQIPTDAVVRLLLEMKKENAYAGKTHRITREDGAIRKAASWCYGALLSAFFFEELFDTNGKPKLMKRDFYESANLRSQDWFIDTEILLKAKERGYKVCKVPIEFKKRQGGTSHIRLAVVLEFLENMVKYKFGKF